jgi:hypothetical protein
MRSGGEPTSPAGECTVESTAMTGMRRQCDQFTDLAKSTAMPSSPLPASEAAEPKSERLHSAVIGSPAIGLNS